MTRKSLPKTLPLINLWAQRNIILQFSWLNIKIRYKGTYLGLVWTALEPTLFFIVLYMVFTSIRIGTGENFAIYLLSGLILYHVFTRGTLSGLSSLSDGSSILTSINLRKEFFPVMNITTVFLLMIVEIGVLFGLMPFFDFVPPWTIVFLPLIVLFLLMLVLGLSYFLSIIFVYVRDIQPLWAVFAHALFFISPIFWYVKDVQGILLEFHKINPIGQIVELGHKIIVFGQIPSLNDWFYTFLISFIVFISGYIFFQKFEGKILEEL